jgi:hypothetical protein
VRQLVTNNFVRGAISGLGVVNLVAGFAELTQLFATREHRDIGIAMHNPAETPYPSGPDTRVDR